MPRMRKRRIDHMPPGLYVSRKKYHQQNKLIHYFKSKSPLMSNITNIMSKISPSVVIATTLVVISLVTSILQIYSFNYAMGRSGDDLTSWISNYDVKNKSLIIGDDESHLMWFIQVSDLHLSAVFEPSRGPDFKKFCQQVIPAVKPSVTIVSGDLTDARLKGLMEGKQQIKEWMMYNDIVNSTDVTKKTLWLDIRGNHDDFGVGSFEAEENYFAKYSVRGRLHRRHYSYYIEKGGDMYAFIAVDACLEPGPNRPFNTVGLLHPTDITALRVLRENATKLANYTIWFGHYPLAAITSPTPGLIDIVNGPYLSGHVHRPNLYMLQPRGILDVEVADWRAKRIFRIAAVDHGLFSFNDVKFPTWPLILITNPKDAKFAMPKLEPIDLIAKSTHIRALVFSTSSIVHVEASIDGGDWSNMMSVSSSSPLFVLPWTPDNYKEGIHTISVKATDSSGQESTITSEFSLDGSKSDFNLISKLLMSYYHQTVAGIVFFLAVSGFVMPLVLLRLIDWFNKGRCIRLRAKNHGNVFTHLIGKAYYMTCVNKVFFVVIGIPLYMTFGPWLVGYVTPEHLAVCFAWGLIVDGTYLPGDVSYILGALYIIFVHFGETVCLTQIVNCRYRNLYQIAAGRNDLNSMFNKYCNLRNLLMCIVYSLHVFFSYLYADAYGFLAWILGMMHTWTLVIILIVWYMANNLQFKDFTISCRPKSKTGKVQDSVPNASTNRNRQNGENLDNDNLIGDEANVFLGCMPKDESTSELLVRKHI